jgi:hypothetical protein
MFLTEYNVRGSTVLPKQSITIAFSMDPRNPCRGVKLSSSTGTVDLCAWSDLLAFAIATRSNTLEL